jgi:hypothetical protein
MGAVPPIERGEEMSTCQNCYYQHICSTSPATGYCDSFPPNVNPYYRDKSLGPEWISLGDAISKQGRNFSGLGSKCRFRKRVYYEWEIGIIMHHSKDGRTWVLANDEIVEIAYVEVETIHPSKNT